MTGQVSPIFKLFQQQFEEAKHYFSLLSKQFKGKKGIELEQKLIFLEIYIDLLSRIHFEEKKLKFRLFSPFKKLFKGLKKVKHLKLIMTQLEKTKLTSGLSFNSYEKQLIEDKKAFYAELYDFIVSTPLHIWEKLYEEAYNYSRDLRPLMINTAITQIINEELEYFQLDNSSRLDSKALKDIYEGLRVIISLENLRLESGFNPIFVTEVHDRMSKLQQSLLLWYENHLFIQHLSFFLTDKGTVSKKYLDLLTQLRNNKRSYTQKVEVQCKHLFERILE